MNDDDENSFLLDVWHDGFEFLRGPMFFRGATEGRIGLVVRLGTFFSLEMLGPTYFSCPPRPLYPFRTTMAPLEEEDEFEVTKLDDLTPLSELCLLKMPNSSRGLRTVTGSEGSFCFFNFFAGRALTLLLSLDFSSGNVWLLASETEVSVILSWFCSSSGDFLFLEARFSFSPALESSRGASPVGFGVIAICDLGGKGVLMESLRCDMFIGAGLSWRSLWTRLFEVWRGEFTAAWIIEN